MTYLTARILKLLHLGQELQKIKVSTLKPFYTKRRLSCAEIQNKWINGFLLKYAYWGTLVKEENVWTDIYLSRVLFTEHPVLYDKHHNEYLNIQAKNNRELEIAMQTVM